MKHQLLTLIISLLLCMVAMPSLAQVVSDNNEDRVNKIDQRMAQFDEFVPGQVLVKFKDSSPVTVRKAKGKFQSASRSNVDAVLQAFGVETMEKLLPNEKAGRTLRKAKAFNGKTVEERDLSQLYMVQMENLRPDSTQMLAEQLSMLDEVEFAEPNYRAFIMDKSFSHQNVELRAINNLNEMTDTDNGNVVICEDPTQNPLYGEQWGINAVGLPDLWKHPIINAKRPIIAILDTGVDITHPDLADNIWTNELEAEGEIGYDNDNNGFVNDIHGWDFINNTADMNDWNSHGTHVAGIAAAANNGIGIVGANPQALIMPVAVMQSTGTGDMATIIKGINYAVENGATVINMSFGSYYNSQALRLALGNAYGKAVLVASAGNDGRGIYYDCNPVYYGAAYPAAYPFVLGVMATNSGGWTWWTNYDCDGATFSTEIDQWGEDGINYELSAPGENILSSVPNGNYKSYNGTSMSAPLVAGGISALKMVKDYESQEVLWGDLIHSVSTCINFNDAYAITDRSAELNVIAVEYNDSVGGNKDKMPDAGETIQLYPTIKTTWGAANNVVLNLSVGDYEDPSLIEVIDKDVPLGCSISSFAKAKSMNPISFKINENVNNARNIRLLLTVTCDELTKPYEYEFTMTANNITKIGGFLKGNTTLSADKEYFVYTSIAIAEGDTLTIEPGTTIKFATNTSISSSGKLNINGTPQKPIIMTNAEGHYRWAGILSETDTISYCKMNFLTKGYVYYERYGNWAVLKDCIVDDIEGDYLLNELRLIQSNFINSYSDFDGVHVGHDNYYLVYSNFINSKSPYCGYNVNAFPIIDFIKSSNYFNTGTYTIGFKDSTPKEYMFNELPYLGTADEDIARKYIFELGNGNTFSWMNLDSLRKEPIHEAHGIVWKVVVNGYDAQDQYDELPPLGVGKHKFEVYFNRPMNTAVAPNISFGVREPYTQHVVAEDGSWSADGKIYTAYYTITGKTSSDGVNRIYVYGAEDDEYFEIPYEKTRFNINIQAAGSMATGFSAEAGLGKVTLNWNNENNDIEDAMGYNLYRYTLNESGVADTVRVNQSIIDVANEQYIDYDVTPGTTYYYLYKTLSTDLKEYDVSNTVTVTPLTSSLGDANGSGDVDVADVITTVNYAAGQDPKPFIYEAADMNTDNNIDILDVIGIIKVILNPGDVTGASVEATATYTVEDGIVYVESPVDLAGVQVQLATEEKQEIAVSDDMKGFEHTSAWLSDNDYIFLGYNMNGKTLPAGKNAILNIGNAKIGSIKLSDKYGHNIQAVSATPTGIDRMGSDVKNVKGIYTLSGVKVSGNAKDLKKLPGGVYIVDGEKVVK